MKILLENGKLIDHKNDVDYKADLLIEDGLITRIEKEINDDTNYDKRINLEGKIIIPGMIDIHTHLREPGYEEKETIKTGCEAAAAGGFTSIACMPNTNPVADNPATVEFIKARTREAAVKVIPIGSITKGLRGKELSEIGFLSKSGVTAISDDGKPVMNSEIMRRAMEYASIFDMTIISHCEDINLVQDGVMNEGYYSTILGLKPIPAAAEEIMIARDIILSELTGCSLHIAHLSTAGGVRMVKEAKIKGLPVTAEATPHHLVLSDEIVKGYDTNTKVNPPLRSEKDVEVLQQAICEGIIDVIATDHAPHSYEDKLGEYDYASFGISGLETALSLIYTNFVKTNKISWKRLVELMVDNPAKIIKVQPAGLKVGVKANLTVFDKEKKWTVDCREFKSMGKNTPFNGMVLDGKVIMTICDGKIVYEL